MEKVGFRLLSLYQIKTEALIREVSWNQDGPAAFRTDRLRNILRVRFLGGKVIDRDIRTFTREGNHGCASDPGIATGDKCLASSQSV